MTDCILGRDHNQPFFKDFETKLTSFLKSYYQYYQFMLSKWLSIAYMPWHQLHLNHEIEIQDPSRLNSHWLGFRRTKWTVIHETVRGLRLLAVFTFNITTITNISLRLGISSCSWILKLWKSITCIRLLVVVGVVLVVTLYPLKRSSFSGIFKGCNSKRPLARNRLTSRLWNT